MIVTTCDSMSVYAYCLEILAADQIIDAGAPVPTESNGILNRDSDADFE